MELYQGAHLIPLIEGDRDQNQFLFLGDKSLLLDTGLPDTPEKAILPYMKDIEFDPDRLTFVLNTHADGDHYGGNGAMKRLSPHAVFLAMKDEQPLLEDNDHNFEERWIHLEESGWKMPEDFKNAVLAGYDEPLIMDVVIQDDTRIRLRDDWELVILHTPSHTRGSLIVYDPKNSSLFTGDAFHGRYCPSHSGEPRVPPIYDNVEGYLDTIDRVASLNAQALYSSHWPNYQSREEVANFLQESKEYVLNADRLIEQKVRQSPDGVTLAECTRFLNEQTDKWQEEFVQTLLAITTLAHLEALARKGVARREKVQGKPDRWLAK